MKKQNPYNYMTANQPTYTNHKEYEAYMARTTGKYYDINDLKNGIIRHKKIIDVDKFGLSDNEEIRDNVLGFYINNVWKPYPNSAELTKNAKYILVDVN